MQEKLEEKKCRHKLLKADLVKKINQKRYIKRSKDNYVKMIDLKKFVKKSKSNYLKMLD